MSKVRNDFHAKERGRRITRLMARDGVNCMICGAPLDRTIRDPDHPQHVTFDHVVPKSCGGLDRDDNYRLAHRACNLHRGAKPADQ